MTLVTHQTGPEGRLVKRLLVEEGPDIAKELNVGMVVDRATQRVTLMASSEGGMEIEEVAAHAPEKIHKVAIDPAAGLTDAQADEVARKIGVPDGSITQARKFMHGLYHAFVECDASLAEINPLIITGDGRVLALDAKLNFDSNALFRHPEMVAMRDLDEEDPAEVAASKFDLSYISLNGNIGCLVNGAGLAMATMDVMRMFNDDPGTDAVIMVGEIGGDDKGICARWIKHHMTKPVVGFVAGFTAPPGKRMGHAGAIISGGKGCAAEKLAVMEECGVKVTRNPAEMATVLKSVL